MRIVSIMWDSLQKLMMSDDADLKVYANRAIDASDKLFDEAVGSMESADLILLYRTTHGFWTEMEPIIKELRKTKRIICVGQDPMYWALSTVAPDICSDVYRYLLNGTKENFERMITYLRVKFDGADEPVEPPTEVPWQGIVHPRFGERIFGSTEEYLKEYAPKEAPYIGIVLSRSAWISGQRDIETTLIADIEAEGMNVIPMMTNSLHNEESGSMNIAECIKRHMVRNGIPVVDAIVKLVTFMTGKVSDLTQEEAARSATEFLTSLNIPIFQPVISLGMSIEEWEGSNGLSSDIAWSIAMPEFEGMIEPVMLGSTVGNDDEGYVRTALKERSRKIARRIRRWMSMKDRPVSERKLVLFLNNNPCASVEANIGSAAGLDSIASTVNILRRLRECGYDVSVPSDPKELMELFMTKKATSEFRWTTKEDIVSCGGAIYRMPVTQYKEYFDDLPPTVKDKMIATWGQPPGESMVLNGDLIITGISFGNVVVAVQPKRGCYGSRCDGTVCKILHDPDCPPTHQYVATYHYFRDILDVDAIVHVGTHGTLEFLPGKGTGLSENCYSDVCIGDTPMIYVYNTDNPPEGSIAKRRCYSTLIGHMQSPMASGQLYDDYLALDELLAQYETAGEDPARRHALHHMVLDFLERSGIKDIGVTHETPMDDMIRMCHEYLARMRNTRIEIGMHRFGEMPTGDKLVDTVSSIMRYDSGRENESPRRMIARMFGLDYTGLLNDTGSFNKEMGMSNGALLEWIDRRVDMMVKMVINGAGADEIPDAIGRPAVDGMKEVVNRITTLLSDIGASDELGALGNALNSGYTPPGPSGYMTRGREDILPTGRNFYSLDPRRIPTTSAWRIGTRLADALIDKYLKDEGDPPESVAFQWMTGDIMASDGEMMAEILYLLGVEPVWERNGHVNSFRVVPSADLTHPRIDVTIRISGILRDNFCNCVDLVDSAVRTVSELEEPADINYVRKHVLDSMECGSSFDEATARIFSSKPGTYSSGVNLAILSGAWKEEKDLAEIYIATNGYAYGNGRKGEASHVQFASNLESVSVTFNKVVTDEHDLLGCCCYYSNQGGMTAAARHLSGKEVKAYYGDTRESDAVEVRTLADEIRRIARAKVLNPKWIEGMKEHGYKGAADMMKKITRVYGWEASTQEVDDCIFDDIASAYIIDPEMKKFFEENNPYAAEEISRRLLEAESRGLWNADPKVMEELRDAYVDIESWMEERSGDGVFQGGSVDIVRPGDIEGFGEGISDIMDKIHKRKK